MTIVDRFHFKLCVYICSDLNNVLGLAVNGRYIFWTDRFNSQTALGRALKVGGGSPVPENVLSNVNGLHGLVAVNITAPPGKAGCLCKFLEPQHVEEGEREREGGKGEGACVSL